MPEIDWELISRYLAGECTATERERVDAWRQAAPERQALMAALLRATDEPQALPLLTARDRLSTWARLEQSMTPAAAPTTAPERPAPRFMLPAPRRLLARAAAVVVLVAGSVAAAFLWQVRHGASTAATAKEEVLRTPRGQRATFQLLDGTRVVLAPASVLRYSADYGRRTREVRLEGEAFFAVKHDARRPFLVRAGDLVAQDLGTEFTVRAYAEDAHALVAVRAGEVGIRAAAARDATVRVLTPGQLGRLSASGESSVETAALEPYFDWIDGRVVFDGAPLRDVVPALGRWFDLDLQLADSSLGSIPVTAVLDQKPTPDVLANIAAALGLTYVRAGRVAILRRAAPQR